MTTAAKKMRIRFRVPLALLLCVSGSFAIGANCTTSVSAQVSVATSTAAVSEGIAEFKKLESKVQRVVQLNTAACVSISDGMGAGSGVVVNSGGLIFTAGHVMVSRGEYTVLFPDGRTARAKPLGSNLNADAGMVQIIDDGPWPYAKVGKSDEVSIGDWVVSLGHSGGFELGRKPPVRTGKLLARDGDQLTTDAVLIGGDSGGPLFNLAGELIGIHSSIGDSVAENRHVPIEVFRRDYTRLKNGEHWGRLPELADSIDGTKPPKMGVRLNLPSAEIVFVKSGSPAADVGIRAGDVVRQFDGVAIVSGQQLIDLVKQKISGDVVRAVIERNAQRIELEVRLK